jgi:hypothetical protein
VQQFLITLYTEPSESKTYRVQQWTIDEKGILWFENDGKKVAAKCDFVIQEVQE